MHSSSFQKNCKHYVEKSMPYCFWCSTTCTSLVLYILISVHCFVVLYCFYFIHYCDYSLSLSSPVLTGRGHISYGPLPLKEHLQYNKCILVHKVIHNKSPQYLRQIVHTGVCSDHSSQNSILILPKTRIYIYKMGFAYSGSFCWNALPRSLKITCSVITFRSKALQHFCTQLTQVFSLEPYSI